VTDRNKFMIIGGVAGAVLGAALAWAYYKQQTTGLWTTTREDGRTLTVQAGVLDFVRIGTSIFAVIKTLQGLAKPKDS
jgi:hypothetical protein